MYFAVAWNGGTDQIWIYDNDLSNGALLVTSASIGGLFNSPTSLDISKDGNLLVTDYTYHQIIEIDTSGSFVKTIGVLHDPLNLFVVP